MYIWIGCRLPEEFETSLRARCVPLGQELGLDLSGFGLPQHISLKISFEAGEQYGEILDFLEKVLEKEKEFYVNLSGVERMGNILWLAFRENGTLQRLHEVLDQELNARFDISQHLFDKAFAFHSTLFLGEPEKLQCALAALAEMPLPKELQIDTFLLGVSETGTSGSYYVVRQIQV